MNTLRFSVLFIFCVLAACSSQERGAENFNETFNTFIYPNGTKIFTYQLRDKRAKPFSATHVSASEVSRVGRPNPTPRKPERLNFEHFLEQKLLATGFCREGYITLEKEMGRMGLFLRGECEEAASDEDRKHFARTG